MPVRVAVVDKDLCQPRKCSQECIRFCPIVRGGGKRAIYMDEQLGHPVITDLCTACGICVRKCPPFEAITIVNLPSELGEDCVHQYGPPAALNCLDCPCPSPAGARNNRSERNG